VQATKESADELLEEIPPPAPSAVLLCTVQATRESADKLLEEIPPPEEPDVQESNRVYLKWAWTVDPEIRKPPPSAKDVHCKKRVDFMETVNFSPLRSDAGASAIIAPPAPAVLHDLNTE
jgi:hypothetical protein